MLSSPDRERRSDYKITVRAVQAIDSSNDSDDSKDSREVPVLFYTLIVTDVKENVQLGKRAIFFLFIKRKELTLWFVVTNEGFALSFILSKNNVYQVPCIL